MKQKLKLTINIADEQTLKYITNAYGLLCRYRTLSGAPHDSLENTLTRHILEGSKAIYRFHEETLKQAEQAKQAETETAGASDVKTETGE